MDLDGRTRQFFSVLSERLKEKGFSSRIADDGCLAVKSKKMRGKEQTQCSVGKDGEVYCRSVDFANISRKRDLESILETVNEVHSDMEPPEAPEQESTQGGITLGYTYNPVWRKGKEAFFATDGSDQSMIVLFAPEGCVINGVDSELYDWEEKLPHIEDLIAGMPPALQKLMTSREVKKMKSTFCVWTEDGTTWHCNPMDGEDASKDLLPTIDGNPQTYVEYGKWFYPADLPLEAVRQLADGVPVTKELVAALNPKRNEWEEIKAGLDKIGYPNEL